MTQQKKTCVKKIKPAGWLALGVFSVLLVGLIGTGCRSCLGVNRLAPAPTPVPVDEGGGEIAAAPETPDTPVPTPDPDEAWETFMEAIYKCDSLEDVGDDLADYPESLDALTAGIEDLTLDQEWIERCSRDDCWRSDDIVCHIRRLAEFGPQNLDCEKRRAAHLFGADSRCSVFHGRSTASDRAPATVSMTLNHFALSKATDMNTRRIDGLSQTWTLPSYPNRRRVPRATIATPNEPGGAAGLAAISGLHGRDSQG